MRINTKVLPGPVMSFSSSYIAAGSDEKETQIENMSALNISTTDGKQGNGSCFLMW
jgi:hypothetical protein